MRSLRVIRDANEIDRADWDALGRRGYHRHAWFVAAEACGAEARHIGVFEGDALVALIPAYLDRGPIRNEGQRPWYEPARRAAVAMGGSGWPSLTVGAPLSPTSEPLGNDAALADAVLEEAMQLLEEEARASGASTIVWPHVEESATRLRELARTRGFRESFATFDAVLDVDWSSTEEFILSRPVSVQRTLRNELAWVHDQGVVVSWERDFRRHASVFDALYRAAHAARPRRLDRLAPQLLATLAEQQSEGVRVQCAWKASGPIEFAVALECGGVLDLALRARVHDANNSLLHHHCLCYDPLRVAIADGLTRIHLGPGTLFPKVVRGARLETRLTLTAAVTPRARARLRVTAPITELRKRAKKRRLLRALSTP